ncbi:MAG TPA: glucoamylase family protein [Pseudomonadales bacterium]|nr:glucoamylase family protein [Pseudomonadales bacterium]
MPLRAELLSADQMALHARRLAAAHQLSTARASDQLLARLADNEAVLVDVCTQLSAVVDAQSIPAAVWLLDNFYLIEEQVRTARRHFPKGYNLALPRLANGPSASLPRVYDIALEAISHGDGRVDLEILNRFVMSYQSVTALSLGELWAIPIMLRLALIENLRRVAVRISAGRLHRETATVWAERILDIADKDPKSLILVISDMARSRPPMVSAFVAELARRLQSHSPASSLPLTWIEQLLAESNLTIEHLVRLEARQQAADQVSISNSMGSLRFLDATDWRDFVETVSVVEKILAQDPSATYKSMDFHTRDMYRHAVEKIAQRSPRTESDVAQQALQLSVAAASSGDARAAHIGFYLVDAGVTLLEQQVKAKLPAFSLVRRVCKQYSLPIFIGAIAAITAVLTTCLVSSVYADGWRGVPLLLAGLLLALCTSRFAVVLVNWVATLLTHSKALPRMDYSAGISPELRTLVVVPTMLGSVSGIEALSEALEVRYLANNDPHLHFALLTDFLDAGTETCEGDAALLDLMVGNIHALNRKYQRTDLFFLLHRPRVWNPQEQIWMGYERKRGKLADLNAFLRGKARECFVAVVGDVAVLGEVRYVITLDTDTQLPRDTARELVAAMAHPLNRAQFEHCQPDKHSHRIVAGYAIMQPLVAPSIKGANASMYAQLCCSEAGIDPYTRTVADVYQNVFGEGSFVGKGIYDVDAFERALDGRLPENLILSHDLLEGCIARSGLLSDSQLYEDYPAQYSADVRRRQRWIRGDWQLLEWLLPRNIRSSASSATFCLSTLSRWKIFDNLLRSLHSTAMTLLLLCGWILSSSPLFWTLVALAMLWLPTVFIALLHLLRKPVDMMWRQHAQVVGRAVANSVSQSMLVLVTLPYDASFSLDAISRTLVRVLVTRRRLLEWNPSSEAERNRSHTFMASWRVMWISPCMAAAVTVTLAVWAPAALQAALPVLCLWWLAPAVAWWISRPLADRDAHLDAAQVFFLRKTARRTWAFFENFVVAEENWLPPDNFQEYRGAMVADGKIADEKKIAHRTSPTNMGLALLANSAAHDFGYIPAGVLLARTASALGTMSTLERYQGHFYNWYDTVSLQALHPVYVSTVDSGNLAAHLLVLRQSVLALVDEPVYSPGWLDGISDTLGIIPDIDQSIAASPAFLQLQDMTKAMQEQAVPTITDLLQRLGQLSVAVEKFIGQCAPVAGSDSEWWLHALGRQCAALCEELRLFASCCPDSGIPTLRELSLAVNGEAARERVATINRLATDIHAMAQMQYEFLFDKSRRLLAIGYNITERRRDPGFYDLLASEARLASFVAIAQRQVPQEHWFALGRLLTRVDAGPLLLSWSGSMFEYLMPLLVMPEYTNTLLEQTHRAVVARQIEYGKLRGVPWGISESGYDTVDVQLNYQYHAFGVPGLGLRRGLAEDLVIAPYASALALMVEPEAACTNLQKLAAMGMEGTFGFYEAMDFTPSRQRRGASHAIVRSFMAHHQGMSLLAIASLLLGRPMQRRFEADYLLQSTLLLLQERVPKAVSIRPHAATLADLPPLSSTPEMPVRIITTPNTASPDVQLLSNGRYHVMVNNAGAGYSHWKDMSVTRWEEDSTCDNRGTFCYIRDVASEQFWSVAHQPTLKKADSYEVIFSEGRAEFRRSDHGLDLHTEMVVSPEDDIELRRTHITNSAWMRRTLEVTSYADVVINTAAADAAHPAFSNLFVQTEIVPQRHAILCSRRARSQEEKTPWMLHLLALHGAGFDEVSYETDRRQFVGRGNTLVDPLAMQGGALSNTAGSVLDPVVAIRYRFTLEPGQTVTLDMVTGMGKTRDMAIDLIEKYQDRYLADRVFDLAWTHSQVLLRQLNASEADAQLYGRLANSIIYPNAQLRADAGVLVRNRRGQSGLWAYAISGDLPIVLLQIQDSRNIELVRQLVQAHAYWRLKGLAVDLVIWNEDHAGYRQVLQDQIVGLIGAGPEAHVLDRPGGIFVRPADQITNEDRVLLQTVARVIISDSRGTLVEQINRRAVGDVRVPLLVPTRPHRRDIHHAAPGLPDKKILDNGVGGFSADGCEYVITLQPDQVTPAPWCNVLANPHLGSVVSESGRAYTWHGNAHEFRLTPWYNDPVCDSSGEAFYVRDEESGHYWSPTPLPRRGVNPYVCRHGFGYSVFEYSENGIDSTLTMFVAADTATRFSVLRVRNTSARTRQLSATGYVEWVLGDLRQKNAQHIITEIEPNTGALCARNAYSTEYPEGIAYFDVDGKQHSFSGDRSEFLGRNGTQASPAAMSRRHLSGKTGAALDPCAAIQVPFELAAGEEREMIFRLGFSTNPATLPQMIQQHRGATAAHAELDAVKQYWQHTLGAVQVETPDMALNVLANGWLLYQVIACRLWARSGYYQSGGAFGFRDQLQDTMALVHTEPVRLRQQLLLCASRQFLEGDVQHWWHPPSGRGVRTHCSDDMLWLPLATCRYVLSIGDTGVLNETIHFLEGHAVNTGEDSYYDLPGCTSETASLYQHCVRAIRHSLQFGVHGLPLMGSGDWNDGMNLVGIQGKGESVWLAFFLCDVLTQFSRVASLHGDAEFAEYCAVQAVQLRSRIEASAWDGAWYRRAYFDDGTALGSANNSECQIDSISQSWSVLSANKTHQDSSERSRTAMNAVYARLVRHDDKLIQLLQPPFDRTALNPGYIKGYVPGVRENGGQYTHGAIWAAMAFAELGDNARAWELVQMINPLMHALTPEAVDTYKVEPYVMAADVYAVAPHIGRGGWSWYTGSAGWMYRLVIESILGLRLEVNTLHLAPCLPAAWPGFSVRYRFRETVYDIAFVYDSDVVHDGEAMQVIVDGQVSARPVIELVDDRQPHAVRVIMARHRAENGA